MNTDELISALQSGDLPRQHYAFEEIRAFMNRFAEEAAKALSTSASPYVIAERIFSLSYTMIPPLERLYSATTSSDQKTISAALLLQLGSTIGVEYLIDTIRTGADYDTVAATSLAKMGRRDALPALIQRLESLDRAFYCRRENAPQIHNFLSAVKRLGGELPPLLKERFTAPDVPPDLSGLIE
jgi:hypothetical protein